MVYTDLRITQGRQFACEQDRRDAGELMSRGRLPLNYLETQQNKGAFFSLFR